MGEAPLISEDELHKGFSNGFHVKSGEYQEATLVVDDKEYVIGGINDGLESSIAVRVIEKTTGKWSVPTVLGIKPKPCEKVLSLALNGDRILLIKKDAPADDTIWFLEINTKFVRDHRKSFGTEVVAWSKGVIGDAQIPIVISGPSGVGKGTLISKLMEEFPSNFGFSVSHTTRAPRIKEKNGIHYHFTERNIMEKEIMDGKFLEFASVHDNLYGTSIEAVEVVTDSGKRCILDIDVQGARSVRASPLEALFIFIRPPSFTELENRLRARGTETEEQIQKRLRNAKAEIEQGLSSGIFDHILENNDLDECYDNLKKLLDLDGGAETFNESSSPKMEIHLPVNHVLSRVGDKIFINCGIQGLPNEYDTEFVLDVSCLKGGAPGRTRGLEVNTKESCLDSKTGMKELS